MELFPLRTLTTQAILDKLLEVFSRFGYLQALITDNCSISTAKVPYLLQYRLIVFIKKLKSKLGGRPRNKDLVHASTTLQQCQLPKPKLPKVALLAPRFCPLQPTPSCLYCFERFRHRAPRNVHSRSTLWHRPVDATTQQLLSGKLSWRLYNPPNSKPSGILPWTNKICVAGESSLINSSRVRQ